MMRKRPCKGQTERMCEAHSVREDRETEEPGVKKASFSPTQHPQNKVQDEERAEDDQAHKVDPGQLHPHRIIHLRDRKGRKTRGKNTEQRKR